MSLRRVLLTLAALLALSPTAAQAAPLPPVIIKGPIAEPLEANKGTGLCVASRLSLSLGDEFDSVEDKPGLYNAVINDFIDSPDPDPSKPNPVNETVLSNIFDLSSNNDVKSNGDFIGAAPGGVCAASGCPFSFNATAASFASRFRGYMNVTADLAGKPIHFGFVTDDAVSLTFWDKNKLTYTVLTRPTKLGFPIWRTTNTVTFTEPGLYPLEVNYIQLGEQAVLEMSYLVDDGSGMFTNGTDTTGDFERPTQINPVISLSDAKFKLFAPGNFFATLSGQLPFPKTPNICAQCERQFVNQAGPNICTQAPGYYCNEAALCAPCESDQFCGSSCSPCGGGTAFCLNVNGMSECVACILDSNCRDGFKCNTDTHTCEECNSDSDCVRGEICQEGSCVPCTTDDACAGNSCNCCPLKNGKKTQCSSALDDKSAPWCVECTANSDCESSVCDKGIGACVDKLQDHNTPACCGDGCSRCPEELKFCLPGPLGTACAECRSDMDCEDNNFCVSGRCAACTEDRRCGVRCTSCGDDTPYCFTDRGAEDAACVRCESDAQCKGSKCNLETHDCEKTCAMSCGPDTPRCDGEKCVECYADTQCPCGGTCDLTNNTCSPSCKSNVDCLGHEHCKWKNETEKDCTAGPMQPVECGGTLDKLVGQQTAALEGKPAPEFCGTDRVGGCTASGNDERRELPSAGLLGLLSVALLAARRGRGRS